MSTPLNVSSEFENWIQIILDNHPTGAFILKIVPYPGNENVNLVFHTVNQKVQHLLNTGELKGKLFEQVIPEASKTGLLANLFEVAFHGKQLSDRIILNPDDKGTLYHLCAERIKGGCFVTLSPVTDKETNSSLTDTGTDEDSDPIVNPYSEKVVTSIVNAFPLAVLITDKKGNIIQGNSTASLGLERAGILLKTVSDLYKIDGRWPGSKKKLKPEDWPLARALYRGETTVEEEIEVIRPDGTPLLLLHNAAPITDDRNQITGSIGIVNDITEFRKAENKKSFLLKLSDTLHFIGDPNQIQSEAVNVLGEHLGASRAGYIEDTGDGRTVRIICNYLNGVDDLRGIYFYDDYGAEILKELKQGKSVIIEDVGISSLPAANVSQLKAKAMAYRPLLKEGKLSAILFVHFTDRHFWTSEEKELIEETAERVWTAVEWARTENKLRKAESKYLKKLEQEVEKRTAELQESRHFTQLITDTTPDIFLVYDIRKWKAIYVNKGVTRMLNYTPEEIYNLNRKEFEQLIYPDDRRKRLSEMARMADLKPGEVRESNFRIISRNGKTHWLNVRDVFFKAGSDGTTRQVLSICRDVTERIEAIEAYRQEKNRSDELKRINELMDTFVFAAAHDLKAPVSNLKSLTQIISTIDDTRQKLILQKKYEGIIETLDQTISGLVKVLAVEKESGSGTKTLSFNKAFAKIAAEMKDEIEVINPLITTDFSSCKTIRYIDTYLYSIFRNLLSNSLKFRKANRRLVINIRSGRKEQYVWLAFSDNGTGINLEKYGADMFKPFRRFTGQVKGSGLGLNLVKSIVTKNGGYIDVISKKSAGTTFTLYMVPYQK